MEKQNCKVGASHAMDRGNNGMNFLETQYRHFSNKAAEAARMNSRLKDFFESKALKIQKQLQQLT